MSAVEIAVYAVHLIFAATWVGATVLMAFGVLPAARDGKFGVESLESVTKSFSKISVLSTVILFLTGGHMAGTNYTFGSLTRTTEGRLVVGMVVLWVVLSGILHMSTSKLKSGISEGKVRDPATESLNWYRAATVVGILLLIDASLLIS